MANSIPDTIPVTEGMKSVVFQIEHTLDDLDNLDDSPDGEYADSKFLPLLKEERANLEHNAGVYMFQLYKMVRELAGLG